MELFPLIKIAGYMLFSGHRNGHGIHSPFVFNLVSEIFQNKISDEVVFKIESIRRQMLKDTRSIHVNDLGSGSKKMKDNVRSLSDIARYSAVNKKYGALLYNLATLFGSPYIIEFGTSLGFSAMYMASSSPENVVYTLEGCSGTLEIASANFREARLENIKIMPGPFDESLKILGNSTTCPGMIFIDGDHTREATLRYFEKVAAMAGNDTLVIIDDINYSSGMADAWKEIKKNRGVTISIDICKMGLVFFRKGINPGSYIIRY